MIFFSIKKLIRLTPIFLGVIVGISFSYILFSGKAFIPLKVFAGSEHSLSGYAWSDNIGWVSFNCTDFGTCGAVDYGVNVDNSGYLSGNAWSSNIGWISFDPTYTSITKVGTVSNGGAFKLSMPMDLVTIGSYLYVSSSGSNAVQILDLANPAAPTSAGAILTRSGGSSLVTPAYAISIGSNLAVGSGSYTGAGGVYGRIDLYDLSNPISPVAKGSIVGAVGSDNNIYPVAGSATLLVVSGQSSGGAYELVLYDISNLSAPILKKRMNFPGSAGFMQVNSGFISGTKLYVTANNDAGTYGEEGYYVIDISNPATASIVGSKVRTAIDGHTDTDFWQCTSQNVVGNYDYVNCGVMFNVFDVSNPANPIQKARYYSASGWTGGSLDGVKMGNRMIISYSDASPRGVLEMIDVSALPALTKKYTYLDATVPAYDYLATYGDYIYAVSYTGNKISVLKADGGCPSGSCSPQVDKTTGLITGWARALAPNASGVSGWDGWINLSGSAADSSTYGVTFSGKNASGYAWGDNVVGWLSWAGAGYGVVNNTTVTVSHNITSSSGVNGSISPLGVIAVVHGTNTSFTITPDSGYKISTITVDGGSIPVTSPTGQTYNFVNVVADHTISATFSSSNLTITSTAGSGGTITPLGATSVPGGNNQSYTITPDSGHTISSIKVDGVNQTITNASGQTYTFTNVVMDHIIDVKFSHVIQVFVNDATGGTVSPSSATVSVVDGADQTFNFSANSGYYISAIRVDTVDQGAISSYSFTNVTTDHTVDVYFTPDTVNGSCGPAASRTVIEPLSGYCNFGNRANYKYDSPTATWGWRCVGIGLGATNADCSTINSCKTNLLCEPQYGETPFNCPSNCKVKLEER
jgi:hypothetical protein